MVQATMRIKEEFSNFTIDKNILRAYDIRGVYEQSLTTETAYWIGKAYATMVAREFDKSTPHIAMAYDGRLSSPDLSAALAQGMQDAGAHVTDTGLGPTPMLYFAVKHLNADGGIMVTGSHNPPSHNGFKMTLGNKPLFGEQITYLGEMLDKDDLNHGVGSITKESVFDAYVERICEGFNRSTAKKELTVVWDAGNGAAGEAMKALTAILPGKHILLFDEIDGTFPNHHPDPTIPANMEDLKRSIEAYGADVGVAFDGDGDRLGVMDGQGNLVWGDQMMMFFAREILSRKSGATVIADVKASQALFDDIANHGGNPMMWKTGHSFIKSKMAEVGAEVAGEMSGHIFFNDGYYGYDDGLYAAVRLLDLLAKSEQSLNEMYAAIPVAVNTPEIRIDVPQPRKFAIIEEIRDRLKQTNLEVNEVDGVRVKCHGGWWLARASNTQDALIVRCEAQDEHGLAAQKAMVMEQLESSGIQPDLDAEPTGH